MPMMRRPGNAARSLRKASAVSGEVTLSWFHLPHAFRIASRMSALPSSSKCWNQTSLSRALPMRQTGRSRRPSSEFSMPSTGIIPSSCAMVVRVGFEEVAARLRRIEIFTSCSKSLPPGVGRPVFFTLGQWSCGSSRWLRRCLLRLHCLPDGLRNVVEEETPSL